MTTRAAQIIEFLRVIGIPSKPTNSPPFTLQSRVATAFGTSDNLQLEHELLLSLLYSLNALENEVRLLQIRGPIKEECIQSIVNLKSMVGPTHWASDPVQWHQQMSSIIRDLSIVDNFLLANGRERIVPKDAASNLSDDLIRAADELTKSEVANPSQRDKVVKIIKILAVMLKNIDASDLDTIIKMTLMAIFELATVKPKQNSAKKIITLLAATLGGAFVFAGQAREAADTAEFVRDIAAVVSEAVKNPKLPAPITPKALPAPKQAEIIE